MNKHSMHEGTSTVDPLWLDLHILTALLCFLDSHLDLEIGDQQVPEVLQLSENYINSNVERQVHPWSGTKVWLLLAAAAVKHPLSLKSPWRLQICSHFWAACFKETRRDLHCPSADVIAVWLDLMHNECRICRFFDCLWCDHWSLLQHMYMCMALVARYTDINTDWAVICHPRFKKWQIKLKKFQSKRHPSKVWRHPRKVMTANNSGPH